MRRLGIDAVQPRHCRRPAQLPFAGGHQVQRHLTQDSHPIDAVHPVVSIAEVRALQHAVEDVYVDPLIQSWIVAIVRATRELDIVQLGASVRGSLALERCARAWALLRGRDYAVPEDVEALFGAVLAHRVLFAPAFLASTRELSRAEVIAELWARCVERAPRPGPDLT
jgi:MoxR-like ATPase